MCRRREVLNLRWRDIGADAINLRDSKTGPRAVPFGKAGVRTSPRCPARATRMRICFLRYAEARKQSSLTACWRAVCGDAKFGALRLHDLRH